MRTSYQDTSKPVTTFTKVSVEVETDFIQVYTQFFEQFNNLSQCEQVLLSCIIHEVSKSNYLSISMHLFNRYISERNIRKYGSASYYRAIDALEKKEFIVFTNKNFLVLNPHLVWKASASARMSAIGEFEQFRQSKPKALDNKEEIT